MISALRVQNDTIDQTFKGLNSRHFVTGRQGDGERHGGRLSPFFVGLVFSPPQRLASSPCIGPDGRGRRLRAINFALVPACARPYRSRWTLSRHRPSLSGNVDDRPSDSLNLGTDSCRGLALHPSGMAQAAGRDHFRAVHPMMSGRVIPHRRGPTHTVPCLQQSFSEDGYACSIATQRREYHDR
jgi:hypothetical protein